MMRRPLIASLLALAIVGSSTAPDARAADSQARRILTDAYPLEVSVSFHVALLHWLDSLAHLKGAGFTAGKTRDAHRQSYARYHGQLTSKDAAMLQQFHRARSSYARQKPVGERDGLTRVFFEAPDLSAAIKQSRALLSPDVVDGFRRSLRYFESRYRKIWKEGRIPEDFLKQFARSEARAGLAEFLVRVAQFYRVPARSDPPPRIFLAPVPRGFGTHAQAIGRYLLLEVRRGERFSDEVEPIVHENAHFLYHRIEPERLAALERVAVETGPNGEYAWGLLLEALPTAIAQGVAGRKFRGSAWSRSETWYHSRPVNAYAKRIFTTVEEALEEKDAIFDEALVRKLMALYEN